MGRPSWLAGFAFVVAMIGTTLPTPLYPLYEEHFRIATVLVPVIFAVYAFGVMAGLMLFGRLSDEIGRRPVLFIGLGLSALSAVAFLAARDLSMLFAGRAISGLSAGIFTGTATATIVDLSERRCRREAAMLAVAANAGGLGLGTLLAGLLAANAPQPLRLPYAVDLALVALACAALLAVPEPVANPQGGFRLHVQKLRVPADIRPAFFRAAIAGMCAFAVSGLFSAIVPSFAAQVLHDSNAALIGAVVFVLFGATAAGQITIDSLGRDRALTIGCAALLVGTAVLAAGVALRSLGILFAAAAIEGWGQGLAMGAGLAEINERVREGRGEVSSTYFVLLYASLAFPVIGDGLLGRAIGLPGAALIFCAIVAAVAALVLVSARSRSSPASPQTPL